MVAQDKYFTPKSPKGDFKLTGKKNNQ